MLAGMVRGASGNPVVDRMATAVALMCAFLQCRIWYEYVESKANWADGPSRLLEACPWVEKHQFPMNRFSVPVWFASASTPELLRLTSEFLRPALE